MRSRRSLSLFFALCAPLGFGTSAVLSGFGCAGVKPHQTTGGSGGSSPTGNGGSTGSGNSTGTGNSPGSGGGGEVPITPVTGNFSCKDFDNGGTCPSFDTSKESALDSGGSGSAPTIAYPLDHSLFPSNLGPIQVQLSTSGTAARINFQTMSTNNVSVNYYGACETGAGSGCAITLPLALTRMLVPASQKEDIQITARVQTNSGVSGDSAPIASAWAASAVTGGLYYWTVLPNQPYCKSSTMADTGHYCLQDTTLTPMNGTAIYRYDFSNDNPVPQQIWTDDGGPNSTPSYSGGPQSYVSSSSQYGGHCIGCHSISNDGKYMALGLGGASTYNGANWILLDIAAQSLDIINPTASTDANSTPTNNPADYWKKFRKDAFGIETTWSPKNDVIVTMYKSALYRSTVAPGTGTASIGGQLPALGPSAMAIDSYQSDPFWSHDGQYLAYTSFSTVGPADMYNVGGLDGDLKTGGQIAIATSDGETINDDAKVLVPRKSGVTSYYPCVSEDSGWVVYNQSACGNSTSATDPLYASAPTSYGAQICDGYDDSTAKLWFASTDGNKNVRLDNANGGDANYDNSWPRFSPDVSTFRGQTLYWVAFSSRRPYGNQINTGQLTATQPQLWFAGVLSSEIVVGDPSYAPVWLPGQNSTAANPMGDKNPQGNHVPQWVKVAISIN